MDESKELEEFIGAGKSSIDLRRRSLDHDESAAARKSEVSSLPMTVRIIYY